MADLRTVAAAVEAERRGVLPADRRAALNELRRRASANNQTLAGYIEPILTIGSAAIAEPVSGFVGLAGLPFGVDASANAIRRTQEAMTYQPRTQKGQENLQAVGQALAPIGEAIEGASSFLGDKTLEATGSPGLATAAYSAPTLALEALGLKGANVAGKSGKLGKQFEVGDVGGQAFGQRGAVAGAGESFSGVVDNVPTGSSYKGTVYHSTDADFDQFDFSKSADGTAWFASDKGELTREGSAAAAAAGKGKVVEADVELNKVAGWDEIDRYSIDELIQQGYDGAILDGDIQIFDPNAIKTVRRDGGTAMSAGGGLTLKDANKQLRQLGEGAYIDESMAGGFNLYNNNGFICRFDSLDEALSAKVSPVVDDAVSTDTSYRIEHTAPNRAEVEDGVSASLDRLNDIIPDDVYDPSKSWRFYGHGGDAVAMDKKTASIIAGFKGKPDKEITIYRAVPKGVKDINAGDWITVNKDYANYHGSSWVDDGQYDVISKKVKAKDIFTNGDSIHEFGYDPE